MEEMPNFYSNSKQKSWTKILRALKFVKQWFDLILWKKMDHFYEGTTHSMHQPLSCLHYFTVPVTYTRLYEDIKVALRYGIWVNFTNTAFGMNIASVFCVVFSHDNHYTNK